MLAQLGDRLALRARHAAPEDRSPSRPPRRSRVVLGRLLRGEESLGRQRRMRVGGQRRLQRRRRGFRLLLRLRRDLDGNRHGRQRVAGRRGGRGRGGGWRSPARRRTGVGARRARGRGGRGCGVGVGVGAGAAAWVGDGLARRARRLAWAPAWLGGGQRHGVDLRRGRNRGRRPPPRARRRRPAPRRRRRSAMPRNAHAAMPVPCGALVEFLTIRAVTKSPRRRVCGGPLRRHDKCSP